MKQLHNIVDFNPIEAGKTMGLAPYGKNKFNIPIY